MHIGGVFELFNNLHNDTLSFIYQGSFNDEITERIIDISETNISSKTDQAKIVNKVSVLLAECFQNVIRHSDNPSFKKLSLQNSGIFITRNIGKSYYITSANLIDNKEIKGLKSKLEHINNLSQEKLKQLYISILSNGEFSSKGGAGLGLIEMARKSGQKLEFDFEEINDEFSYFYLQIRLKDPEDTDEAYNNEKISVSIAKNFHRFMNDKNIFIINKGDFSQHTIVPILRMIDDNIQNFSERNYSRKKIFHVLVEILQNVSKHAYELQNTKEGIFMMGRNDDKFYIYTGNFILNTNVDTLKELLNSLNTMKKEQLDELYKLTLHLGVYTSKGGAGLGLIDIARDSADKLHFGFYPVDDKVSFYAVGVKI